MKSEIVENFRVFARSGIMSGGLFQGRDPKIIKADMEAVVGAFAAGYDAADQLAEDSRIPSAIATLVTVFLKGVEARLSDESPQEPPVVWPDEDDDLE